MPQEKTRREKSYYEVALSSSQVVVAVVGLIGCLFVAFAAGVWLGRGGTTAKASANGVTVSTEAPLQASPSQPQPAANVPTMNLFSEDSTATEPQPATGDTTAPSASQTAAASPENRAEDLPARLDVAPPLEGDDAPPRVAEASQPEIEPSGDGAPRFHRRQKVADEASRLEAEFERERAELAPQETKPETKPEAKPAPAQPLPATSSTPAAPEAPKVEAKKPAASGTFVVQVLSTKDQARARRVLGLLQESGYPATLSTVSAAGGTAYRIRVGPYRDRPGAEKAAGDMKLKFQLDTWITSD